MPEWNYLPVGTGACGDRELPDDATLQDAAEKLALLAALEKSRESVKTGHWKPQADVEKLLPQWLEK